MEKDEERRVGVEIWREKRQREGERHKSTRELSSKEWEKESVLRVTGRSPDAD